MTSKVDTPSYDVVVVGGSQAGLAVGYHLKQRGLRFVILDAAPEIGHVWRSRWDSLTLFTPAQYSGLPGMDFPAEKDSYASRHEVAAYLKAYASAFDLPVKGNARVTSVSKSDGGYLIAAADKIFQAGPSCGCDRSISGSFRASYREWAGSGRYSDSQRGLSKPGSTSRGTGARGGWGEFRVPDRRGARRN